MARSPAWFLAALALSLVPVPTATARTTAHAAKSYRIVTSHGFVTRLGPWRLRNPSLGQAIKAFGRPTSVRRLGPGVVSCSVQWSYRRIVASFYNLGGQDGCSTTYGYVDAVTFRSTAWRTLGGLRVGHRTSHMLDLYPGARLAYGHWGLTSAHFGFGSGDGWIPTVTALPRKGRVAALSVFVHAGGE